MTKESTENLIDKNAYDRSEDRLTEDRIRSIIDEEVRSQATDRSQPQNIEETLKEINERKIREPNIIFFNVKECQSKNKEERKMHDFRKIDDILNNNCNMRLDIEEEVTQTRKLGTYESTKIRPLLVTLKEPKRRGHIFRNIQALKTTTKYKNVAIQNDLMKQEREEYKRKQEKASRLQQSESSGKFTNRVRGPPWGLRIVKLPKALQ